MSLTDRTPQWQVLSHDYVIWTIRDTCKTGLRRVIAARIRNVCMYTGGQKKRYRKILSCIACGSQTRAAQITTTRILSQASGFFLFADFVHQAPRLQNVFHPQIS